MGDIPVTPCTADRSSALSFECVCTSSSLNFASIPTASSSSRVQESAKRGAYAYPMRPAPALLHRFSRPALASRESRVFSTRLAGTRSPVSIIAWPKRARIPDRTSSSATTSPQRVVPMSRIVVVPVVMSSPRPSRTHARTDASSCAASSGQMKRRSQSRRPRSSASPRKIVCTRCTCVCTSPGMR